MNSEYFSLPLREPLSTANGDIHAREGFLVSLDDETGVGEACPLPGWTESFAECRDALDTATPETMDSLPPAARHGVSLACLDADARDAGKPLYRHLGATNHVETVPVNATVGDSTVAETREQVETAWEDGYSAIKLKVGARSLADDLDRVRAARAVASDLELRLDANGAWDVSTAQRAFETLDTLDIAYVEQPLSPDTLDGLDALADFETGVALDEGLYEHGLDAVLDASIDTLVVKPMAAGGPDIAIEMARLARGAGIDPVITTTIDGVVARAGAVHVAAALPDVSACGLATGTLLATDFEPNPLTVSEGEIRVPQKKGNTPAPSPADYA